MTLLGGVGTLYGPILGAMLVVYLKNLLSNWVGNWNLILGPFSSFRFSRSGRGSFPFFFRR